MTIAVSPVTISLLKMIPNTALSHRVVEKVTPLNAQPFVVRTDLAQDLFGKLSSDSPVSFMRENGCYYYGPMPRTLGETSEAMSQYIGIEKEGEKYNFHKTWFPDRNDKERGHWISQNRITDTDSFPRSIFSGFVGHAWIGEGRPPSLAIDFQLRHNAPTEKYWIRAGLRLIVPLDISLISLREGSLQV